MSLVSFRAGSGVLNDAIGAVAACGPTITRLRQSDTDTSRIDGGFVCPMWLLQV